MAKFRPGQSGNPAGKPKGTRDRRTALRELLTSHAPDLVNKAVELALAGDSTALKMCLDRIVPGLRPQDEPVQIHRFTGSLTQQGAKILKEMGAGRLSPTEARDMLSALSSQTRIEEFDHLLQRIARVEEKLNGPSAES